MTLRLASAMVVLLAAGCGGSSFGDASSKGDAGTADSAAGSGGSAVGGAGGAGGSSAVGGKGGASGAGVGGAGGTGNGGPGGTGQGAEGGTGNTSGDGGTDQGGAAGASGASGDGGDAGSGASGMGGSAGVAAAGGAGGSSGGPGGTSGMGGAGGAMGGTSGMGGVGGGTSGTGGVGGTSGIGGGGGTSGTGGTTGGPVGRPWCGADTDCELHSDCCTCAAHHAGEKDPPLCGVQCIIGTCESMMIAQAHCDSGACTARIDCDVSDVFCLAPTPVCPAGKVLSQSGGCYGPCVDPADCDSIPDCSLCSATQVCIEYSAFVTKRRCVDVPSECGNDRSCSCLRAAFCQAPFTTCSEHGFGLSCDCPTC